MTRFISAKLSRLSTLVGYAPRTKPDPPSELRRRAYAENTLPLGPEVDPDGWSTFSDRGQRGSLFKQRDVRIDFSVRACLYSCQADA